MPSGSLYPLPATTTRSSSAFSRSLYSAVIIAPTFTGLSDSMLLSSSIAPATGHTGVDSSLTSADVLNGVMAVPGFVPH